ncbi:MAG: methyltransferase dimerization domain-containing protein [Dehalococcoidia bacterium]
MNTGEIFSQLANRGEPDLLTQLSMATWPPGVLRAAIKMDLFTKLKGKKLNSAEIAKELGASDVHMEYFLNACAAIGLLNKTGDQYQNASVSDTYLVEGEPRYMAEWVLFRTDAWTLWELLHVAVLTGDRIHHELEARQDLAGHWHSYMMSMHQLALSGQQDVLVENVDLRGKRRLLDVAAGAASYSMAFCRAYPDLTAVVFDQEKALPLARSLIEAEGLSQRISTLAGDWLATSYGSGYDAVLFSGCLCQEPLEVCRKLIKKAYDSMISGGLIIVQDLLIMGPHTETHSGTALWSLAVRIFFGGRGGCHNADDMAKVFTSVGFTSPKQILLEGLHSVVTAVKP